MIELDRDRLGRSFGLGVAGNFAGHLEQAGEASDFTAVDAPERAPKGIFPWYAPGASGYLGEYPLAADEIILPESDQPLNLQIEPEAAAVCSVEYRDGLPVALKPQTLVAFNDCSIRRPGARKISEKKNWGACSKGIAASGFATSDIARDGAAASLRIASFLRRSDESHAYGVDSPVAGYSYFGDTLLEWIIDRLRNQRGGDTPLEDVGALLSGCGSPAEVVIGLGATRYTEFGEHEFLTLGDQSIVVLYDESRCDGATVTASVEAGDELSIPGASVLSQTVRAAG